MVVHSISLASVLEIQTAHATFIHACSQVVRTSSFLNYLAVGLSGTPLVIVPVEMNALRF